MYIYYYMYTILYILGCTIGIKITNISKLLHSAFWCDWLTTIMSSRHIVIYYNISGSGLVLTNKRNRNISSTNLCANFCKIDPRIWSITVLLSLSLKRKDIAHSSLFLIYSFCLVNFR